MEIFGGSNHSMATAAAAASPARRSGPAWLRIALISSSVLLILGGAPQPPSWRGPHGTSSTTTTVRAFYIDERQSPHTSEWNYYEQVRWHRTHRDCSGRAQSPIDIQHKNVITSPSLRLHFYNYNKPLRFKLSNAHHTIKMNPTGLAAYDPELAGANGGGVHSNHSSSAHDIITADEYVEFTSGPGKLGPPAGSGQADNEQLSKLVRGGAQQRPGQQQRPASQQQPDEKTSRPPPPRRPDLEHEAGLEPLQTNEGNSLGTGQEPYEGAPTIKLDWLDDGNNEYKLRDIHFHWGERRDNGSEHAIDGRRAAMEMHLVHIKHGLDKSKIGFTSDSVTVIAILIESHRKSNADFNPIVNELSRINTTEQAQEIDYKSIYDLLPSNLQAFYTYSGSLTTPPCYEVVNWIVMAERLNMNAKQIEMFRNLYAPPKEHEDVPHASGSESGYASSSDEEREERRRLPGNQLGSGAEGLDSEESSHAGPGGVQLNNHNQVEMIMPNVRLIQPLNNRTILASFTKYGSRLEVASPSANLFALSGAAPLAPLAKIAQYQSISLAAACLLLVQAALTLITVNTHQQRIDHAH